MIIDFLLFLFSILISVILVPLELLSATLSSIPQFDAIMEWFITAISYFSGVLNIPALFTAITIYLNFLALLYTIKILLWLLSLIPIIGNYVSNPFNPSSRMMNDEVYSFKKKPSWQSTGKVVSYTNAKGNKVSNIYSPK